MNTIASSSLHNGKWEIIIMKTYAEMITLFESANDIFLEREKRLLFDQVSEQALCGRLMLHLNTLIAQDESWSGYYVDVEYNRNGAKLKTIKKTTRGANEQIISIKCDLILHSRGEHPEQDNLIALEMKKSKLKRLENQSDRDRLRALTRDRFDDVCSSDGITLPEHVCRYVLGIYYEIIYDLNLILIEDYREGEMVTSYELTIVW